MKKTILTLAFIYLSLALNAQINNNNKFLKLDNSIDNSIYLKRSSLGNFLFDVVRDNNVDKLQVNGTVSASPATLSNQVVIKSQLDLKADLAGTQTFTGIHNFPTATSGTNNTQVATTAFVLANNGTGTTTLQNAYDNSANGTVSIGATKPLILKNSVTAGNTKILTVNSSADVENISILGNGTIDIKSSSGALVLSSSTSYTAASTPTLVNKSGLFTIFGSSSVSPTIRSGVSFDLALNTSATLRTLSIPNKDGVIALKSDLLYTNQTITANKTVTIAEFVNNNELVLRVDATAGNITVTLPTFTALQGYKVTVRKVDSSANSVLIQSVGGVNIDGASTLTVSGQYGKATIGADLVQYIIL